MTKFTANIIILIMILAAVTIGGYLLIMYPNQPLPTPLMMLISGLGGYAFNALGVHQGSVIAAATGGDSSVPGTPVP